MGIDALLQDGLALGMLEVFCIRKSVPFERVKTAKIQLHKLTKQSKREAKHEMTLFFSGGMDRVSPNLCAFIQLPKEALFAAKSLTTLHL